MYISACWSSFLLPLLPLLPFCLLSNSTSTAYDLIAPDPPRVPVRCSRCLLLCGKQYSSVVVPFLQPLLIHMPLDALVSPGQLKLWAPVKSGLGLSGLSSSGPFCPPLPEEHRRINRALAPRSADRRHQSLLRRPGFGALGAGCWAGWGKCGSTAQDGNYAVSQALCGADFPISRASLVAAVVTLSRFFR